MMRLLVLGGSIYQVPFIRAARALGSEVVSVDNRPDNPGHALADKYVECDTTDVQAVLRIARRERVTGVLAAATDVALDAAALVAESLALRGPGLDCAHYLTRKREFRQLQARLGLPYPVAYEEHASFPCIVKPNRSSGSKGIRIVEGPRAHQLALQSARSHSIDREALTERFLPGIQGTAEGVMEEGRISACMITQRITTPPPHVATVAHLVPTDLASNLRGQLLAQIGHVFHELGYTHGPFDCDFVAGEEAVTLIELTPRPGGNSLVKLLMAAAGFDMPDYAVRHALGVGGHVNSFSLCPAGVRVLGASRAGRLSYSQAELNLLRQEPWVHSIEMDRVPGDLVEAYTDGRHRIGDITVSARNPEELDQRMAECLARLEITTIP